PALMLHARNRFGDVVGRRQRAYIHPRRVATVSGKIGIVGYDSFHFAVEDFERSRAFYTQKLDFKEVARASDDLRERGGQQWVASGAGDARLCVPPPLHQSSKPARSPRPPPAGVMSLSFRVKNLDETIAFLDKRGGTFLAEPIEHKDANGGRYR